MTFYAHENDFRKLVYTELYTVNQTTNTELNLLSKYDKNIFKRSDVACDAILLNDLRQHTYNNY